jgi:hypothetical protein
MVIGENREKDLAQLETFVKREKLAGQIAHLFYHHLRVVYPLEFIHLARKHNKSNAGHQYYIQQAKEQINRAYGKMNIYLITPPESEEQIKEFEYVVRKLQQLLIKQNKEN